MYPVVGLPVDSTAKESLTKLDGSLRERADIVIKWHRDLSASNAIFDPTEKRTEMQQSGKIPR